jgi:hypothetical protein
MGEGVRGRRLGWMEEIGGIHEEPNLTEWTAKGLHTLRGDL